MMKNILFLIILIGCSKYKSGGNITQGTNPTLGYTLYSQATAITFGTVYSQGSGDAQIYDQSSARRDLKRQTLDFIISADYGF